MIYFAWFLIGCGLLVAAIMPNNRGFNTPFWITFLGSIVDLFYYYFGA